MNLENSFFVFENALPSRFCDDLVEYGNQQATSIALTGEYGDKVPDNHKDISKLYKTRNSSIIWMKDPWIYNSIVPYIHEANSRANWNFQIRNQEACQWTKYAETQHYTWHQDSWNKPYNKPGDPTHGQIRKL